MARKALIVFSLLLVAAFCFVAFVSAQDPQANNKQGGGGPPGYGYGHGHGGYDDDDDRYYHGHRRHCRWGCCHYGHHGECKRCCRE